MRIKLLYSEYTLKSTYSYQTNTCKSFTLVTCCLLILFESYQGVHPDGVPCMISFIVLFTPTTYPLQASGRGRRPVVRGLNVAVLSYFLSLPALDNDLSHFQR